MRFISAVTFALAVPFTIAAPIRRQISETDLLVLKFAHVLEQLETEFYKQALTKFVDDDFIAAGFGVPDVPKQIFLSILEHEDAHTNFLADALGAQALDTCIFNFDSVLGDVATMAAVARLIEQVGVGAYLGGANLISDKSILLAAAGILTIESRHQSALNILNGGQSVPQAFDLALSPQQVLALAAPFISGCDLGIPANLPVIINNAPGPGQVIDFDFGGLGQQAQLFCQMLIAGQPFGLVQDIENCIVPDQLPDGPVFLFITSDHQPLTASIVTQNAEAIVAGPAILFIDQIDDALASLALSAEVARDFVAGPGRLGSIADINVIGLGNSNLNRGDINVVGFASSNVSPGDINALGHVFVPAS